MRIQVLLIINLVQLGLWQRSPRSPDAIVAQHGSNTGSQQKVLEGMVLLMQNKCNTHATHRSPTLFMATRNGSLVLQSMLHAQSMLDMNVTGFSLRAVSITQTITVGYLAACSGKHLRVNQSLMLDSSLKYLCTRNSTSAFQLDAHSRKLDLRDHLY